MMAQVGNMIILIKRIILLTCHVAVAGSDYTPLFGVDLGFYPYYMTSEERCVDISINDDSEQEETETIDARVRTLVTDLYSSYQGAVLISITDNDG
jgi:hypothetical protein